MRNNNKKEGGKDTHHTSTPTPARRLAKLKAVAYYRDFWWCLAEPQLEVAYEIVICDLLKPMKPIIAIISIIIGPHCTIICAAFPNPGVLGGSLYFTRKRNGLGGMSSITITYVTVMEDMPCRPLRFLSKKNKNVLGFAKSH